ncbi:hypothetical protein ACFUIY_14785 [Streptomyces griseorubiginosus]|uniref:hypothetical protein n=1 Tax=Streptomyces griseorubiginosus TaxID=67304 RepID=UPI003626BC98
MLPGLVAFLQTLSTADTTPEGNSPRQGTTTTEWFVAKAAALLKDGHTPDSAAAAIITGNHELLRPARGNVERVLRFGNRRELHAGFTLFARAYEGDRVVKRVSHANGAERIDFHNGTSILFHVGASCLWPLACDYPAPCPGCQPHPETLMRPSIVTFLETILSAEAVRQRNPFTQWHDKECEAVPSVLYPDLEPGACTCGVPEQVLAEIEARRALLDEHQDVNDGDCGTCVDGSWGYPTHGGSSPQRHPCRTLRLLAPAVRQPPRLRPDMAPAGRRTHCPGAPASEAMTMTHKATLQPRRTPTPPPPPPPPRRTCRCCM